MDVVDHAIAFAKDEVSRLGTGATDQCVVAATGIALHDEIAVTVEAVEFRIITAN